MKAIYTVAIFVVQTIICFADNTPKLAEDCRVYHIHNAQLRNISYTHQGTEAVAINFLHTGVQKQDDVDIQIFVYLPPDYQKYLMIYVKEWTNISLTSTLTPNASRIVAQFPPSVNRVGLFWNALLVRIARNAALTPVISVSVSRPGEVIPLFQTNIDLDVDETSVFRYTVTSRSPYYTVFNCLKGCPVFGGASTRAEDLSIMLTDSIFIRFISDDKSKSTFVFNATIHWKDNSSDTGTGNYSLSPHQESIFKVDLGEKVDNNQVTITWNQTQVMQKQKTSQFLNVHLSFQTSVHSWTLSCNPPIRQGKSLSKSMVPFRRAKPKSAPPATVQAQGALGIAEVIAWMVAVVAICGVVVMGLTLYTKVRASPDTCLSTASHTDHEYQYDDHSALQMAEFRPQVSFKRKQAEECSEPRSSVIDPTNLIQRDHFYPMKISTDDELSVDNEDIEAFRTTTLSRPKI